MSQKNMSKIYIWFSALEKVVRCGFIRSSQFHCSAICLKEKKKFYNRYIKQYRPHIDTSYVESHLEKTYRKSMSSLEEDEVDFEGSLLNEARKRRNMYQHKKWKAERMEKKPTPQVFTNDQMQHIKFLRDQNPELWTHSYLAKSFGVDTDTIQSVLKRRLKQSTEEIEDFDQEIARYRGKPALMKVDQDNFSPALNTKVVLPPTRKVDEEVKNNPWFQSFDNSSEELQLEFSHEEDLDEFFEQESHLDDHCELFDFEDEDNDLEEEDEDEDISLDIDEDRDAVADDKEHDRHGETEAEEEGLEVKTDDNITFYDNEGRFLYKVS